MAQWKLLTLADHGEICNAEEAWWPALGYLKPIAPVNDQGQPYHHVGGGKLPRANRWRPYRLTMRNALLAVVSICYSREDRCLDVDLCAAAEPEWLAPGEAWRAVALFILADAYKNGGTMAVRFRRRPSTTGKSHGESRGVSGAGRCPEALVRLAEAHGVQLARARTDDYWNPAEAKALYLALSAISPELRDRLRELAAAGHLSAGRLCYLLSRGVWTAAELEVLIRFSRQPEISAGPDLFPEQRHFYAQALEDARSALLAQALVQRLTALPLQHSATGVLQRNHETRPLRFTFLPDVRGIEVSTPQRVELPHWRVPNGEETATRKPQFLETGKRMLVLVRNSVEKTFCQEVAAAARHYRSQGNDRPATAMKVLLPFDVTELDPQILLPLQREFQEHNLELWRAPDFLQAIDQVAARKLTTSSLVH